MISSLSCGVVVYDEVSEIKRLVPHLKNELQGFEVEWIFVLNHEESDIRNWMKTWLTENVSNSVCIENPSNNLGYARQLILENASEKYIYMTDPDIEVAPGGLTKLIQIAEVESLIDHNLKNVGFGGTLIYKSTHPFLQETFDLIFSIAKKIPFSFQIQHHSKLATVDHIPSCHLLLKKDVALEIGGFSPLFARVGEDLDFTHRAYNAGYNFVFLPTSQAYHFQNFSIDKWLYKVFMFGKVQITVQKLNYKNGLRFYRLLPVLMLIFSSLATYWMIEVFYMAAITFMFIGVFNYSLFGLLLTGVSYSLGEFFEIVFPTIKIKNEEELLELKQTLSDRILKTNS